MQQRNQVVVERVRTIMVKGGHNAEELDRVLRGAGYTLRDRMFLFDGVQSISLSDAVVAFRKGGEALPAIVKVVLKGHGVDKTIRALREDAEAGYALAVIVREVMEENEGATVEVIHTLSRLDVSPGETLQFVMAANADFADAARGVLEHYKNRSLDGLVEALIAAENNPRTITEVHVKLGGKLDLLGSAFKKGGITAEQLGGVFKDDERATNEMLYPMLEKGGYSLEERGAGLAAANYLGELEEIPETQPAQTIRPVPPPPPRPATAVKPAIGATPTAAPAAAATGPSGQVANGHG